MTDTPPDDLRSLTQEAQRSALVDAACELVRTQGMDALTLRRLAKRVGASTTVVYTAFGGKDGLLRAIVQRGLDELSAAMAAVPPTDGLAHLEHLALAYRAAALRQRTLYRILQLGDQGDGLDELHRQSGARRAVHDAVCRCVAQGHLAGDPDAVTDALWAVVHGMVSLELGGFFASPAVATQRFVVAGRAMIAGFRPPG